MREPQGSTFFGGALCFGLISSGSKPPGVDRCPFDLASASTDRVGSPCEFQVSHGQAAFTECRDHVDAVQLEIVWKRCPDKYPHCHEVHGQYRFTRCHAGRDEDWIPGTGRDRCLPSKTCPFTPPAVIRWSRTRWPVLGTDENERIFRISYLMNGFRRCLTLRSNAFSLR